MKVEGESFGDLLHGEQLLLNAVSTASDRREVMVLGAISATGKSQLVIVRGNLTAQSHFLNNNSTNCLQWPVMSSDLNPIEHLWDPLDRDVRHQQPRTITQLENAPVNAWNGLNDMDVGRLCLSIRRRCTAVINAVGGHMRY